MRIKTVVTGLVLGMLVGSSTASASLYSITDLGVLPGGTESGAYDINDRGQIVGLSNTGPYYEHAFVYQNGAMASLGTIGMDYSYRAFGINSGGQAVGITNLNSHAVLYSDGKITDLGTLGGYSSSAEGISNNGQIVGYSDTGAGSYRAFLYSNGKMTSLGTLPGSQNSAAFDINDIGQIVGNSSGHAFLYQNGEMTNLGTLGGVRSDAYSINAKGQIVGTSWTIKGDPHAFLSNDGVMTDLGTLGGPIYASFSNAIDINDDGLVVGTSSSDEGGAHSFLYAGGHMHDLHSLLAEDSSWTSFYATGINNSDQIVGSGTINGRRHAFLMSPIPEPGSIALLVLALASLALFRWRVAISSVGLVGTGAKQA